MPTATLHKLTPAALAHYRQMQQLAEEITALNAKVQLLKDQKSKLAALVEQQFDTYAVDGVMRVSAHRLLKRTVINVAEAVITRSAYSYSRWSEVQD